LASTYSRAPRTRRKRRRQLTTTPCTIPGRPRARIRTKVLLRHILETPLHGLIGIDLHIGQKPKLGGEVRQQLTHLYIIFCRYFVYPCFAFFLFLCYSCFISAFQNTKRPKIFPLFLFVCFFSFLVLVCFTFYFRFGIRKIQKDFTLFVVSFCPCLKIQKPKNICCSFLVL
jgi:hypothetical protein